MTLSIVKVGEKRVGVIEFWLLFLIIWIMIGYFVYDSYEKGIVGIAFLWILYGLVFLLSLIPFCGVFIQGLLMYFLCWPLASEIMKIEPTWLTAAMFLLILILGALFTLAMSFAVLAISLVKAVIEKVFKE